MMERFPYGVYCIVDNGLIVVLAILHFSRNTKVEV
jgi:hypothetical protein